MHLRTQALDCLYLNWALPRSTAPALPRPLRYEVHSWRGDDYVFASALLFRLSGLHFQAFPLLRVSYPQMNLRLYVLDENRMPAVFFHSTLVPFWVAPWPRFLGRQPATSARFSYPPAVGRFPDGSDGDPGSGAGRFPGTETWRWLIRRRQALEVTGRPAAPAPGPGPDLGSWSGTVGHFRQRWRGFVVRQGQLRAIHLTRPPIDVVPVEVDIRRAGLLSALITEVDPALFEAPHSSWICPQIPFRFELGKTILAPLTRRPLTDAVPVPKG